MENNVQLNGASAPKTKLLTILTCIFAGLVVTMGLCEYLYWQFDLWDLIDILRLEYNGLNDHGIIFNLMCAVLVVVTIVKNRHRRMNGWLVLAIISSYLMSTHSQFRYSLFWYDIAYVDWEVIFDVCSSYIPLTILVGYCLIILPLLWKRNKWSITIAILVAVMILCQRLLVIIGDYGGDFYFWYESYNECQYTFGFLLFYNLMPTLITLLLFYVMLRDAITSSSPKPVEEIVALPEKVVYCRNCGKPHAEEAEFCMNCGVRAGVGDKYCSVCGAKPDPLAEICVRCKTMLKK